MAHSRRVAELDKGLERLEAQTVAARDYGQAAQIQAARKELQRMHEAHGTADQTVASLVANKRYAEAQPAEEERVRLEAELAAYLDATSKSFADQIAALPTAAPRQAPTLNDPSELQAVVGQVVYEPVYEPVAALSAGTPHSGDPDAPRFGRQVATVRNNEGLRDPLLQLPNGETRRYRDQGPFINGVQAPDGGEPSTKRVPRRAVLC